MRRKVLIYEDLLRPANFKHFQNYKWDTNNSDVSEEDLDDFFLRLKQTPALHSSTANVQQLNSDQQAVFDYITQNQQQTFSIVQASGGCGKSFLIKCLSMHFKDEALLCAFTGCAAYLIGGHTISSAFSLTFCSKESLSVENLRKKQVRKLYQLFLFRKFIRLFSEK